MRSWLESTGRDPTVHKSLVGSRIRRGLEKLAFDWTRIETSTHQDHVIAHVIGATVLGAHPMPQVSRSFPGFSSFDNYRSDGLSDRMVERVMDWSDGPGLHLWGGQQDLF